MNRRLLTKDELYEIQDKLSNIEMSLKYTQLDGEAYLLNHFNNFLKIKFDNFAKLQKSVEEKKK